MLNKPKYLQNRERFILNQRFVQYHNFEENTLSIIKKYENILGVRDLQSIPLNDRNEAVASLLYSKYLKRLLETRDFEQITVLSESNISNLTQQKSKVIKNVIDSNISLIVIRPEINFLSRKIEQFLSERNIRIVIRSQKVLNFREYWALYNHAFTEPACYTDFPTRTLTYLSDYCQVLVLQSDDLQQDQFNSLYKGVGGKFSKGTLRGDVIYQELIKYEKKAESYFFEALDPLGIYRALINSDLESDGEHNNFDSPFLYYVGAGIHSPESHELQRDLSIFLSQGEIYKLSRIISNT